MIIAPIEYTKNVAYQSQVWLAIGWDMADDQLLFCTVLETDLIFMLPKFPQEFIAGTF